MREVDVLMPVTKRVCYQVWFACEVSNEKEVLCYNHSHRDATAGRNVCACALGHRTYAHHHSQIHGIPPEQSQTESVKESQQLPLFQLCDGHCFTVVCRFVEKIHHVESFLEKLR